MKRNMGIRDARKARLSDPSLLSIFMTTRKASLADGCSLVEASERAHEAVDLRVKGPVIVLSEPMSSL